MKRILLISNKVLHYRARIYNEFYDRWKAMGYEFHVLSNEYQPIDFDTRFVKHQLPFGIAAYSRFISELHPEVVINFLHLRDKMIIPLTLYCRCKHIPMIYWNHGVNLKDADNRLKNAVFHFIHSISNAIILYTPDQLKYISRKNNNKTFIAYNTLCLNSSDEFRKTIRAKKDIKRQYSIKEKHVLLYISRILPYKGLDILLGQFAGVTDLALVVVGGGINNTQREVINQTPNFYYLGEKYGDEVDEVYSIGDVFSTPGHIGLALNQAFYWGLPVVVLNRTHAPEIYYLHDGVNGYIVDDEQSLKQKVIKLCQDETLLAQVSASARLTYENEMSIDNMFKGFTDAITYVLKRKA